MVDPEEAELYHRHLSKESLEDNSLTPFNFFSAVDELNESQDWLPTLQKRGDDRRGHSVRSNPGW